MKNCKNCGSNDRFDSGNYRICRHCGTRVLFKKKYNSLINTRGSGGFMNLTPLLDSYDMEKSIYSQYSKRQITYGELTIYSPSIGAGPGQLCPIHSSNNSIIKPGMKILDQTAEYHYVKYIEDGIPMVVPFRGDMVSCFKSGDKIVVS